MSNIVKVEDWKYVILSFRQGLHDRIIEAKYTDQSYVNGLYDELILTGDQSVIDDIPNLIAQGVIIEDEAVQAENEIYKYTKAIDLLKNEFNDISQSLANRIDYWGETETHIVDNSDNVLNAEVSGNDTNIYGVTGLSQPSSLNLILAALNSMEWEIETDKFIAVVP